MKKLKYVKLFENFETMSSRDFLNTLDEYFSEFPNYDLTQDGGDGGDVTLMWECDDSETAEQIQTQVEGFVEKLVPHYYKNFIFFKQVMDNQSEEPGMNYDDDRCDLTLILSNDRNIDISYAGPSETLLFSTNE